MKFKQLQVSVKAGPDDGLAEGEFLVYPSTFTRKPDSYGDVVAKGAFVDSIAQWKASGDVLPGMYLHDPNQIVASAIDMGEDDHGWWVKGQFDDDPAAQRIYQLVKSRRLTQLSFAYDVLEDGSVDLGDGETANELRKLDVHEFSFLPKGFAANSDTSVVDIKSDRAVGAITGQAHVLSDSLKSGRVLAGKHVSKLKDAHALIAEVLAAAEDADDDSKASPPEGGKDAPQGAPNHKDDDSRPATDSQAAADKAAAEGVKSGTADGLEAARVRSRIDFELAFSDAQPI